MKKFKVKDLRLLSNMQISNLVLYVLIGITALVFLLFRLVGFNLPYDENPDYNAPLFTGMLIAFMLLLTLATLVLAVWSLLRSSRMNRSENIIVNNIPARRISVGVAVGTALLLVLTFALSSTDAITVNGTSFGDSFWLRASGMFIGTSIMLIAAAVAAVVYGATRNIRKDAHKA